MQKLVIIMCVLFMFGCSTVNTNTKTNEPQWIPDTMEVFLDASGELAGSKIIYKSSPPSRSWYQYIFDETLDAAKDKL